MVSSPANKRLGILGGTFDPPHIAHLALAEQGRVQLGLAKVVFCPAGQQPLKAGQPVTPAPHRLRMVELAIAGHPDFILSRVDVDRPGPHYTADTLAMLRREYPDPELYFLMGADSLRDLLKWREPQRIVAQAYLAVARRPGVAPDLAELEAALPGVRERIVWIDAPWLDVAARDIRRRVRNGLPIRYLVPLTIQAYIEQNKLYQQAE
jgi:nicotinate-nucleotide adenylyltransferase